MAKSKKTKPEPEAPTDPYAQPPSGGAGALIFLGIIASLLALAIAIGYLQGS